MWEPRPVRADFKITRRPVIHIPPSTIRGEYKWRVFDGDGKPTLTDVVMPDGHVRRLHEMGPRKNLILNAGFEALCQFTRPSDQPSSGMTGGMSGAFDVLRQYLRVGTGSAAPNVTDTALDSEAQYAIVAGTNQSLYQWTDVSPTAGRLTSTVSRRVTLTADRNLTEFGLNPTTTANDRMFVRQLFRDEFDVPITLSILNGKTLQVEHTIHIDFVRSGTFLALDIDEYDITNTLVGTTSYSVEIGAFTHASTGNGRYMLFAPSFIVGGNSGYERGNFALSATANRSLPFTNTSTASVDGFANRYQPGWGNSGAYTPLSGQRTNFASFSVDQANHAAYAYGIATFDYYNPTQTERYLSGYTFRLSSPTTFTKSPDNTLTMYWTRTLTRT